MKRYAFLNERVDEVVAILSDGIPRTYLELGALMGLTNAQVYHIVRAAIDSGEKTLVFRKFKRSNRHYVMVKSAAIKLGGIWNTELINSPITFSTLVQLKETKWNPPTRNQPKARTALRSVK